MPETQKTDVPCNGCVECCRSGQALVLHPEHGDRLQSYQHVASGSTFLLATRGGQCVYLGDGGCTIYERRPFICRTFDCREHYLILPKRDRDNLVRLGLCSRSVFNAGRARVATLSAAERSECVNRREEFFS